jgi:hypothetical protein
MGAELHWQSSKVQILAKVTVTKQQILRCAQDDS